LAEGLPVVQSAEEGSRLMARSCTVCQHEQRAVIDRALLAGEPTLMRRHREAGHLPARLVKAQEAAEVAEAESLLTQLLRHLEQAQTSIERAESHYQYTQGLAGRALKEGDLRTAVSALSAGNGALRAITGAQAETRACHELLLELQGELDRRAQVNILVSPEFMRAASAMIEALAPYPDARVAAAAALRQLEAGHVARR
jgi:hypothetical protein